MSGLFSVALKRFQNLLATPTGALLVKWVADGVGAVVRTIQDKMRETVSLRDFGAVGDGVTDDTLAIQRAFDYSRLKNVMISMGEGAFLCGKITYGTNSTTEAQSSHGPGIRGCGQGSRFIAKAGTTGFLLNARAMSGAILKHFVIDCVGTCGGIDTSWSTVGPSQQNDYQNVWVNNYKDIGWSAQNNNDSPFRHCHVRGANGSDPVGFDLSSGGGLISMEDCFWYDAKLIVDCQNGVIKACGGMGIHVNGMSFNALELTANYIYSNAVSKRCVWTAGGKIVSLVARSCHWPVTHEGSYVFDGTYVTGIDSVGDNVVNAGDVVNMGLMAPTATNVNGNILAKAEFRNLITSPGVSRSQPASGFFLNFLSCLEGGTAIQDSFRIGGDSNTVITASKQVMGSVPSVSGVVTQARIVNAANGAWINVGDAPIYFGSGRVLIYGIGNEQPVLNMAFGRTNTNVAAGQTIIHQQQATTTGEAIAVQWLAGAPLQWRVAGGSRAYILRVFEDYVS